MVTEKMIEAMRDRLDGIAQLSFEEALAALEAALLNGEPPVLIKPLEWVKDNETTQYAESIVGYYHIDRRWTLGEEPIWHWKKSGRRLIPCRSEVEAKAAAQADFDARIRSALA